MQREEIHLTVLDWNMTGTLILLKYSSRSVFCLGQARKVICRNAHANIDLQLGETDTRA